MIVFIVISFLILLFISRIGYLISKIIIESFKIKNIEKQIIFKILFSIIIVFSIILIIFNAL
jgi:hypothetical protein